MLGSLSRRKAFEIREVTLRRKNTLVFSADVNAVLAKATARAPDFWRDGELGPRGLRAEINRLLSQLVAGSSPARLTTQT